MQIENKAIDRAHEYFFSEKIREQSERYILAVAIISYLTHLVLILLANNDFISTTSNFLTNPIAAIYTPFSFILLYEVYLLIFYLPNSVSVYIAKQYEIITLIVIRRIFKDIAYLELKSNWFESKYDLMFTYDVLTSIVLFGLILLFYQNIKKKKPEASTGSIRKNVKTFISFKKLIAILLLPILFLLAVFSFGDWLFSAIADYRNGIIAFKSINKIFYDEFFTILIITDVLLLLASFFYSDKFHKIIRNSGFIISTVLIKISFSTNGLVNNALIVGAVVFGLFMLIIHNEFEKRSH